MDASVFVLLIFTEIISLKDKLTLLTMTANVIYSTFTNVLSINATLFCVS